jgi:hypothetical protein
LDSIPRYTLSQERQQAKRQKLRQAETLVQLTPLIIVPKTRRTSCSTVGDDKEEEPILTWGRVSSTPLVLAPGAGGYSNSSTAAAAAATEQDNGDYNDDDGDVSAFQLPRTSARDDAAEMARATMERRAAVATASAASSRRSGIVASSSAARKKSSQSIMRNNASSSLRSSSSSTLLSSSSRQAPHRPTSTVSVRSWNSLGSVLRAAYGGGGGGGTHGSTSSSSSIRRRSTTTSQRSSRNSDLRAPKKKDHVHRATPRL